MDDLFFETFLRERAADLRRIATATQGELEAGDMASEAYLMALRIGAREGRELSFTDWHDQDAILAALWVEHVRQADWVHRNAMRLYSEDADGEDYGFSVVDQVPASETSDPLMALLLADDLDRSALDESYSQAAAWVVVFSRFDNDKPAICAYFLITRVALKERFVRAIRIVRAQASLFDGVERIAEDFMPPPGKTYAARVEQGGEVEQWAWEF